MYFRIFIALLLPIFAMADFDVWYWDCSDGFDEFDLYQFATDGQASGICDFAGCSADGAIDPTNNNLDGGNPCNPDCNADPLNLVDDGNGGLNIIVQNTGIQVGNCYQSGPAKQAACSVNQYGCTVYTIYRCVTGYCN